ncbi:MAG TPA: hypothetical protein VGA61_07280 [Anaerolineae bacterium]
MNAGEVKQAAKQWVAENLAAWPSLRAAHLVGSVAAAPDDAPFPAYKDVDMHLIFDEGSPMLISRGPFLHPIEAEYRGLMIEAGLKPVADYRSPEAVLANPEIADHLWPTARSMTLTACWRACALLCRSSLSAAAGCKRAARPSEQGSRRPWAWQRWGRLTLVLQP